MIIVKLKGGLGNQMFQYAAARGQTTESIYSSLKQLNNVNEDMLDHTFRNYELKIFKNIKARNLSNIQDRFLFSNNILNRSLRILLYGRFDEFKHNDPGFIPLPEGKNLIINGYFQSYKYFNHIRDEIISEFQFPSDLQLQSNKEKIVGNANSVALHVRRGDYLKPNFKNYHGVLSLLYYINAIQFINSKIVNPIFYVFSDDIEWCKINFRNLDYNFEYFNKEDDTSVWYDMYFISLCTHHIIANSSYSWWGSWLSTNNGITIAPKKWFNPLCVDFDIDDIIPSQWIKLDND